MKDLITFIIVGIFAIMLAFQSDSSAFRSPALAPNLNQDSLFIINNFTKYEYQIPMRDGVKLFTSVYIPNNRQKDYPILLSRTPYGVGPYGTKKEDYRTRDMLWYKELVLNGYIWVYQDVRGRYMSEGEFTNPTPHIPNKSDPTQTDESSDAYDTVEWLIANLPNHNGNVGVLGISYRGYYATCAGIDAHPAIKAISPQAPLADFYFDDFHHNGAFFFSYYSMFPIFGIEQDSLNENRWWEPAPMDIPDLYEFGLRLGPMKNANLPQYFDGKNVFWNQIMEHPDYDEFWQERNILPHLNNISPAVMTVAGWYDAEDLYGSFKTYAHIEQNNPNTHNILIAGPWVHGGWARTEGRALGDIYFGEGISDFYRDSMSKPFFDYYLKGEGNLHLPEAWCFDSGKKEWTKFEQWPPEEAETLKLYLQAEEGLAKEGSKVYTDQSPYTSFLSDPNKPVPYAEGRVLGMTKEYMADDQRFAAQRPDVLVFKTDILEESISLTGKIQASLWVSTTARDADWVVKLIDVYPDDHPPYPHQPNQSMAAYQRMVRSEVLRGRYRNSFSDPEPFIPGQATEINIELQDVYHTFKKGHRLMIQIQSSWFPLIDRNPQSYVPNIYLADEGDFKAANHRIYHSAEHPSRLELKLLHED